MRYQKLPAATAAVLLCVLLSAAPAAGQVSGDCFLSDQTDHSGVSVVFTAGSPSAVTDSTLTDALGYYSIVLAAGIYDVEYRKDGYIPQAIPDPIFVGVDPVVLPEVTLEPGNVIEVSGSIGTAHWASGTIARIVDNAYVGFNDTLTIDPGVRVLVSGDGYYTFSFYGTVFFAGAEGDSIIFESELPDAGPNEFNHFSFNGCAGGSVEYCVFRHASSVQAGGWCQNPQRLLEFSHCTFEWMNYGLNLGLGPVSATDCVIRRNNITGAYLASADSNSVLTRCRFVDNTGSSSVLVQTSTGWPHLIDCVVEGDQYDRPSAYGIDARGSSAIIRGCTVRNAARVAGIALDGGTSMMQVEECLITDNADGISAGFVVATIRNNTIAANDSCGIDVTGGGTGGGPYVFDNILSGNGVGLRLNSPVQRLEYNDVHGNTIDAEGSDLPLGYGVYITVNANGDPADIYYNIAEDPLFADVGAGDYTLQPGSPCLDAGDPALVDPDGTVIDLGAFFRDQVTAVGGGPVPAAMLLPNAPNPFNPRTVLRFSLGKPGPVVLDVVDVRGRLVRRLLAADLGAGRHEIAWDGRDSAGRAAPSGLYLGRLRTPQGVRTGKMELVR